MLSKLAASLPSFRFWGVTSVKGNESDEEDEQSSNEQEADKIELEPGVERIAGIGTVTLLEDCFPFGVIDGIYYFKKPNSYYNVNTDEEDEDDPVSVDTRIRKGSEVEYTAVYCKKKSRWKVITIILIKSAGDLAISNRRKIITAIGQVVGIRTGICTVKYGISQDDIQEIPGAFLPQDYTVYIGDFLRVKVEFNDPDGNDDNGKILLVEPTLKKHFVGTLKRHYNQLMIDDYCYFERRVYCGRTPNPGDVVKVEAVECQQGKFKWRPIRIQQYTSNTISEEVEETLPWTETLRQLFSPKAGVYLLPDEVVRFSPVHINQIGSATIQIANESSDQVFLTGAKVRGDQAVCKFWVDFKGENFIVIEPSTRHKLEVSCKPEMLGATRELMIFEFQDFRIGRYLSVTGLSNEESLLNELKESSDAFYQSWNSTRCEEAVSRIVIDNQRPFLKGVSAVRAPYFMQSKLGFFKIPQSLWVLMDEQDEDGLVSKYPGINGKLKIQNYMERFSVALWLEEMESIINRRKYDIHGVILRPSGEHYKTDVPNIKDIQPTLLLGDPVVVFDPTEAKGTKYGGFIYEIRGNTVSFKFNEQFDRDLIRKGSMLTLQFEIGRTGFRRCHNAVALAIRYLGEDWLFPSADVICKAPRIPFIEDIDEDKTDLPVPGNSLGETLQDDEKDSKKLNLFKRSSANIRNGNSRVEKSQIPSSLTEGTVQSRRVKSLRHDFVSDTKGPTGVMLSLKWFNKLLNQEQKDAVRRILRGQTRPLPYIVYGPPGTGKTVTIVEAIMQVNKLDKNSRILVVAPSNAAADVIANYIIQSNKYGIGDFVRLIGFLRQDWQIPDNIRDFTCTGESLDTVARHRLIISTCTTAGQFHQLGLESGHFTHVFIDEAGYCTEPEAIISASLVALGKSGQVVLAGDPKQLGPVLLSNDAIKIGLSVSFLERLMELPLYSRNEEKFPIEKYNPLVLTKLLKNYRAHHKLLKLPSKLFYDDELEAFADEKTTNLSDSLDFLKNLGCPILFHGIQGKALRDEDSPSWYNPAEVIHTVDYVRHVRSSGVPFDEIGIITPYRKQVEKLRKALEVGLMSNELPKVGSVEEFQGSERSVMIMSLVRTIQDDKEDKMKIIDNLRFIYSPKRFNVAITRAKALLIVIGNPHILVYNDNWLSFLKYCVELECYTGCDLPKKLTLQTDQNSDDEWVA